MNLFGILALWATGLVAGLSVLALPFWLMGVPGVANSYAKGWKLGLYTVAGYPFAWFCLFSFRRSAVKQASTAEDLAQVGLWSAIGSLILLAGAVAILAYAFKLMSRK